MLNNNGMLGESQAFLESFNWTDDSLRDLETVNVQNIHSLYCGQNGYLVKSCIEYKRTCVI